MTRRELHKGLFVHRPPKPSVLLGYGCSMEWMALFAGTAAALIVAGVDAFTRRIPNRVVIPAAALVVALVAAHAVATGSVSRVIIPVACGLASLIVYFALAWHGAMGMGDVKLAGLIGLALGALGWQAAAVGIIAGFACGGLYSIMWMSTRGRGRGHEIPWGPWMALGMLTSIGMFSL